MPEKPDNQITLFIRDEKTGRYAFNARALKALGVDPAEARERGYHSKNLKNPNQIWLRKKSEPRAATPQNSFSLGVPYTRC